MNPSDPLHPDDICDPRFGPLDAYRVRCMGFIHIIDFFSSMGMPDDRIFRDVRTERDHIRDPDNWIPLSDGYIIVHNCQREYPFFSIYDWQELGGRLIHSQAAGAVRKLAGALGPRTMFAFSETQTLRLSNYQTLRRVKLEDGRYDYIQELTPPVVAHGLATSTRWTAGALSSLPRMCGADDVQAAVLYDQVRLRNLIHFMHGELGLAYDEQDGKVLVNRRAVGRRIRLLEESIDGRMVYSDQYDDRPPYNAVLVTDDLTHGDRLLVRKGDIFDAPYGRCRICWEAVSARGRFGRLFEAGDRRMKKMLDVVTEQAALAEKRYFESERLRFQEEKATIYLQKAMAQLQQRYDELHRVQQSLENSEGHLRSMLESADGFAIYRLEYDDDAPYNLHTVFVSPSIRPILGYSPDDFRTTHYYDKIHPEDQAQVLEAHRRAFETGRYDAVARCWHAEKQDWVWIHAISTAVVDDQGRITHVNGILIDVTEKKEAEEAVRTQREALLAKTEELEEKNVALNVLIHKREDDRHRVEERIAASLKELVFPILERLKRETPGENQRMLMDVLSSTLNTVTSSFAGSLSSRLIGLTTTETQVAAMIRQGRKTREIAAMLKVSPKTIESHRERIREKLGIKGKKMNLRSYLMGLQ